MLSRSTMFRVFGLCLSWPAWGMQAMDDQSLANSVAQAGLTVSLQLQLSNMRLAYTDTDGLGSASVAPGAGSLGLRGFALSSTQPWVSAIDVGSNASGQSILQIDTQIPQLNFAFNGVDIGAAGQVPAQANLLLTAGSVGGTISPSHLVLQLGDSALQGHLAVLTDTSAMAVSLGSGAANQMVLVDPVQQSATSTPGIGIGQINLSGLDFGQGNGSQTVVDVTGQGLQVSFQGAAMSNVGMQINNVTLGETCVGVSACTPSAPGLGNFSVSGFSLAGATFTLRGH